MPQAFSQRTQRTARSLAGRRVYQVGYTFRLRQIKLIVKERTLGKLGRLSQTSAQLQTSLQYQLHYG